MPAFDRLAYSDGRCFGLKLADLRARGLELPDPPSTLQPNEIELLADFLFAKVIGKGPIDRAAASSSGAGVEACESSEVDVLQASLAAKRDGCCHRFLTGKAD